MMLRNRSRAVGSKQAKMAESQFLANFTDAKLKATSPSLFRSPRLLAGFSPKSCHDHEVAMSPTSTLETKHFSNSTAIPFCSDAYSKKPLLAATFAESEGRKPASLGILDVLNFDDKTEKQSSKLDSRMVLFAGQLKIRIPSVNLNSSVPVTPLEIPSSPVEFGIKNKDAQLALFSPATRTLPAEFPVISEMELSEDYTCVIYHGANPRTTHIFDNLVVESSDAAEATKERGNPVIGRDSFCLNNSVNCWVEEIKTDRIPC